MNNMASTILAVTDLTSASYKLVGFAAFIAGPTDGEVILVSTYGGGGGSRLSEPPPTLRANGDKWRDRIEARLRQEGQLLETSLEHRIEAVHPGTNLARVTIASGQQPGTIQSAQNLFGSRNRLSNIDQGQPHRGVLQVVAKTQHGPMIPIRLVVASCWVRCIYGQSAWMARWL